METKTIYPLLRFCGQFRSAEWVNGFGFPKVLVNKLRTKINVNYIERAIPYPEVNTLPVIKCINPYPTAFPYGNGMVLHFYQQQESSTTKTVHKVIYKGLKAYV